MGQKTLFEKLGVQYEEKDDLFYPVLGMQNGVENKVTVCQLGKYGRMWIQYIKENEPQRYRSLNRFGELYQKAKAVDDEANELLDKLESSYLQKHMPKGDLGFVSQLHIRNQARMVAEEFVIREVVKKVSPQFENG